MSPTCLLHFEATRIEGKQPLATVEFHQNRWHWTLHPGESDKSTFPGCDGQGNAENFFDALRQALQWGKTHFPDGGAVGFTSYEFAGCLEPQAFIDSDKTDELNLPHVRYTFFGELEKTVLPIPATEPVAVDVAVPMSAEYEKTIHTILDYIGSGHIYQANYVQRFESRLNVPPSVLFERLWHRHPMPFSALLQWDDFAIVSNSPERFLKVQGDQVLAQPIKGTCRRGKDLREDDAVKVLLQQSPKNRAENVMITDLMRNDLGRVCEYGSVQVPALCLLHSFPTLHHLVSIVEGRLRDGLDALDAFAAAFPCGSITGAPKIRAMQIIDELEQMPRGAAMGALGYIDFNGDADWNVAIRTVVCKDQKATFHVGGGIVEGSTAEDEWNEMQLKAGAIKRVLSAEC